MEPEIIIRKYELKDARFLADIFYHTIHKVNNRDYTEQQINAWAPLSSLELFGWQQKWTKIVPLVAVLEDTIVGFVEFEPNGHIDCFYVHHEYQGKGVGTALMAAIETEAKVKLISRIYAEVSITAKSFFLGKGFQIIKKQNVMIRGCELTNFVTEKNLNSLLE